MNVKGANDGERQEMEDEPGQVVLKMDGLTKILRSAQGNLANIGCLRAEGEQALEERLIVETGVKGYIIRSEERGSPGAQRFYFYLSFCGTHKKIR